jgi:hypothetical protein
MNSIGRPILLGTLVAGTLDIVAPITRTWLESGRGPSAVLHTVASGPFGEGVRQGGVPTALLGLAVHFAIMAVMVSAFVLAARRLPVLTRRPVLMGALYGIGLYLFMYGVVLPLRWGRFPGDPVQIAWALAFHIVLVGIPIALITARYRAAR